MVRISLEGNAMLVAEASRRIDAPIDGVWTTVTAIGGYPGIVRSYLRVDYLTPHTSGIGTSWRQTRSVYGREHAQILRVVDWDPPHRFETTARESGASYSTTFRLAAVDGATEVTMRFTVEATNPFGACVQRVFGRRLLASTAQGMERDLADLGAAAEGRTQARRV